MKKINQILLFTLLTNTSYAAVVASASTGDWNTASTWDNAIAPSSGNDYTVGTGHTVTSTSPGNTSTVTFAGDSLTVNSGGILEFYNVSGGTRTLTAVVPNLTVAGGTIRSRVGYATNHFNLSSQLTFSSGGNIEVGTTYGTYSSIVQLNGAISGNGTVNVTRDNTGSGRTIQLNGDISGFSGNWNFSNSQGTEALNVLFGASSAGWGSGLLTLDSTVNLTLDSTATEGSLSVASGSTVNLGAGAHVVGAMSVDGNNVAIGVYDTTQLAALGYGGTFTGAGTIEVVPEPSSTVLLGLAGLGLMLRRRK